MPQVDLRMSRQRISPTILLPTGSRFHLVNLPQHYFLSLCKDNPGLRPRGPCCYEQRGSFEDCRITLAYRYVCLSVANDCAEIHVPRVMLLFALVHNKRNHEHYDYDLSCFVNNFGLLDTGCTISPSMGGRACSRKESEKC